MSLWVTAKVGALMRVGRRADHEQHRCIAPSSSLLVAPLQQHHQRMLQRPQQQLTSYTTFDKKKNETASIVAPDVSDVAAASCQKQQQNAKEVDKLMSTLKKKEELKQQQQSGNDTKHAELISEGQSQTPLVAHVVRSSSTCPRFLSPRRLELEAKRARILQTKGVTSPTASTTISSSASCAEPLTIHESRRHVHGQALTRGATLPALARARAERASKNNLVTSALVKAQVALPVLTTTSVQSTSMASAPIDDIEQQQQQQPILNKATSSLLIPKRRVSFQLDEEQQQHVTCKPATAQHVRFKTLATTGQENAHRAPISRPTRLTTSDNRMY
jgi:hypothetical protein